MRWLTPQRNWLRTSLVGGFLTTVLTVILTLSSSALAYSAPISEPAGSSSAWLWWVLVGIVAVLVILGVAWLIARRHRQEPVDLTRSMDHAQTHSRIREVIDDAGVDDRETDEGKQSGNQT